MRSEFLNPEPPNVFFIYNEETKDEILLENPTHVRVDPSVKGIHDKAFEDCSLVEAEFSEGLERIGSQAFYYCENLQYINRLPSTLKEIFAGAFGHCESLGEVKFPERLQVIGVSAFNNCRNLKRIQIPSPYVVIEDCAFSECSSLISVELPEGLQVIRICCFGGCESLTTVNVPSSVIVIQDDAFAECSSLVSLALPEGLQSIGVGSFHNCRSLATLHIPSTVRKIGRFAFSSCTGLRSITLPEMLENIEEQMFNECTSLQHIEIPTRVTKIGKRAFLGCQSLTHVRISSSVTRIEQAAFANCNQLISLELPEGLEMIDLDGDYGPPFLVRAESYGCRSLVNLVMPSKQEHYHYDQELFMERTKLRHVAIDSIDLVSKLQHRFDDLPVHRLCYYQSYYPVTEAMEHLRQVMYEDPSFGTKIDSFGMTPIHILALSQTPNLPLFQALLKVYKVDIIRTRDNFGSTPIDYLCLNHSSDSAMVIQSLLQTTIDAQRLRWLGLDRWKSDILAAMDEALAAEWSSRRRGILLLYYKLATYERLESISLLELALWKIKIDEAGSPNKLGLVKLDLSQEERADRQSCRIYSGAHVVIWNVLPFLDKVCIEDY
jgi:hypothetical protein